MTPVTDFHNAHAAVADRVADLLRLMTAEEKVEQTRLGIPLLVGEDCIHGHSFWEGATIFPTQLGMAGTWDLGLAEQVARVSAVEVAATGVHWTFSPVLCIARDLRWGRVSETFGEDSYLIGELAAAMVRGYQGKGLTDQTAILATANTRTDRRADRVAGGPGRHRNPLIVVLLASKPLVLPPAAMGAAALIWAANPGMAGGPAIAELLLGLIEPSGRLPISFPRHVGQQPTCYNQIRGQHGHRYADLTQEPAFAFGEGLSYTRVEYRDLTLEEDVLGFEATLRATVTVENVGDRGAA